MPSFPKTPFFFFHFIDDGRVFQKRLKKGVKSLEGKAILWM